MDAPIVLIDRQLVGSRTSWPLKGLPRWKATTALSVGVETFDRNWDERTLPGMRLPSIGVRVPRSPEVKA